MRHTILTIVGARPQFVKAAMVSRAVAQDGAASGACRLTEELVHTGQHFHADMSNVFFEELHVRTPARHLGVSGGSHGSMTGRMLCALEEVLLEIRPSLVLVYGDTNSTLAGALAAAKLQIPLAHVEAGLRSFNRRMPEEINRVLTDHLSDILIAPTEGAVKNLGREGIKPNRIHQLGDVMYDAALFYGTRAEKDSMILEKLGLQSKAFVLATYHRAENTDDVARLKSTWEGLEQVARRIPVVLPLHPRTRKALEKAGIWQTGVSSEIQVTAPLGYLDLIMLEKHARLVVTDSGGLQKEAFFHGVPCVTLRDETEWTELVQLGWNRLAPPLSPDAVTAAVRQALEAVPPKASSPYGDGTTAPRIVALLKAYLCESSTLAYV